MKGTWKLEVGDQAPDFELIGTGDTAGKGGKHKKIKLSDYRGKNVVIAFYPAAFTPV